MNIYRVTHRTTNSLQHHDTCWEINVVYCGVDRNDARGVFHMWRSHDFKRGFGSQAAETIVDVFNDARTDDFADDNRKRICNDIELEMLTGYRIDNRKTEVIAPDSEDGRLLASEVLAPHACEAQAAESDGMQYSWDDLTKNQIEHMLAHGWCVVD